MKASDFFGREKIRSSRSLTLCCFSPPVMLATMAVELALAIYVLLRYRHGAFAKVAVLLILLLGIFQLAEYQICGDQSAQFWSHFGLIAITLLPIVGLKLISFVTKRKRFLLIGSAIALALALLFAFFPQSIAGSYCGGNYIVFGGPVALYEFYGIYYFAFLIFAIWEAVEAMRKSGDGWTRRILAWFVFGYLSFMIPMGVVYAFYAPARIAVTSIMCGFAVILAFIVAFQIVPKYYKHFSGAKAK